MRSPVFKNPDNENLELLEPMNYFKRNLIKSSILPALVILLLSCSREGENGSKPFFSVRIVHSGIYCDSFNWNPIPTESIMVPEPDEISGIAPSLANDDQYWLHEDKGNIPRLMLYDTLGVCKANYFLQGFEITDLEDVSLAVIEEDTLIFLGDVGDNNKSREYVKIISLSDKKTQSNASVTVSGINNYMIKYPADDAGIPIKEDCEAFCFDPLSSDFYFFSKNSFKTQVYRLSLPLTANGFNMLQSVGEIALPNQMVTAANISFDGKFLMLKTYENIYFWERSDKEPIETLLTLEPVRLPYIKENHGEAACFSVQKNLYLTVSEKTDESAIKMNIYHRK